MTDESDRWRQTLRQNAGCSEANWCTVFCLSLLFGWLGLDRFYLNSPLLGLLKLITLGGLGPWWLLDLILLCGNRMRDDNGGIVRRPF